MTMYTPDPNIYTLGLAIHRLIREEILVALLATDHLIDTMTRETEANSAGHLVGWRTAIARDLTTAPTATSLPVKTTERRVVT